MGTALMKADLGGIMANTAPWPGPVDWRTGVVVYGAGKGGREFARHAAAHGLPIRLFCDDDAGLWGQKIDGVAVCGIEALREYPNAPVVIALARFKDVVEKLGRFKGWDGQICFSDDFFLHHYGDEESRKWDGHFDRSLLERAFEEVRELDARLADGESKRCLAGLLKYRWGRSLADLVVSEFAQYEHPVVRAAVGDAVVDGGAWIGDTAERFAALVGSTGRVFAFEPTPATCEQLRKNTAGVRGIVESVNAGLGASDGEGRFSTKDVYSGAFCVASDGDIRVRIRAVDSFCRETGMVPRMIKMDIEGSELAAIEGAKETLRVHKPKLAICVYHKPADLWEIPRKVRELHPGYRFYLGQHTRGITETVMYAVDGAG